MAFPAKTRSSVERGEPEPPGSKKECADSVSSDGREFRSPPVVEHHHRAARYHPRVLGGARRSSAHFVVSPAHSGGARGRWRRRPPRRARPSRSPRWTSSCSRPCAGTATRARRDVARWRRWGIAWARSSRSGASRARVAVRPRPTSPRVASPAPQPRARRRSLGPARPPRRPPPPPPGWIAQVHEGPRAFHGAHGGDLVRVQGVLARGVQEARGQPQDEQPRDVRVDRRALPVDPPLETGGGGAPPGGAAAAAALAEAAAAHARFPAGLLRGALTAVGCPCAVAADASNLPACVFTVKLDRHG